MVEEGVTGIVAPFPTKVPPPPVPHPPEYQAQFAPDPKEPPVTESVVEPPGHIGFVVAPALVGAAEKELMVKVTLDEHTPTVATTVTVPGAVGVNVVPAIVPFPVPGVTDHETVGLLFGPPSVAVSALVVPMQIEAFEVVLVTVVFCLYLRMALVPFHVAHVA